MDNRGGNLAHARLCAVATQVQLLIHGKQAVDYLSEDGINLLAVACGRACTQPAPGD